MIWGLLILTTSTFVAVEVTAWNVIDFPIQGILQYLVMASSMIFFLDILQNIFIIHEVEIRIKSSFKKQFKSYFFSWFLIDFLSVIPFELLITHKIIDPSWQIISILRVLRITRFFKMSFFMKHFGAGEFENPGFLKLGFFIFWLSMLAHWVACGWIYLGFMVEESDRLRVYIRAIYWSYTTLVTVGYGDITPVTNEQTIYTIFVMIAGAGFYGYVIGNIASIIANRDLAKAQFLDKMDRVNNFMNFKNIPQDLKNKISEYYFYLWESKRGYEESQVMQDLPSSLKMKVALYLNKEIFQKIPLFHGAEETLIEQLVEHLQPVVYTPGDYIVRKGEVGYTMFFINRGQTEVIAEDGETVLARLHEGNFFGEIALLMNVKRTASIRAADFCDLYTLDKDTFDKVIKDYPDFAEKITQLAEERKDTRTVDLVHEDDEY